MNLQQTFVYIRILQIAIVKQVKNKLLKLCLEYIFIIYLYISYFRKSRAGEEEDGGEGVKENDIWNKFVSDDQDVVRAPTAESGVSGLSGGSQMTGSNVTGSQGMDACSL